MYITETNVVFLIFSIYLNFSVNKHSSRPKFFTHFTEIESNITEDYIKIKLA